MRESQTAVLERGLELTGECATEPFETPWAAEARWFVQFLEPGRGTVSLRTQISADGLTWVDHENAPVNGEAAGILTAPVRDFGHWLRLVVTPAEGTVAPLVRIVLSLKE
ncbi:hypothetical protein [Brachybacterium sacelli]|uniref:Uncharacterized protein n=2 Tax=Brachybacterium sacelli TaxID=173364 RepID=A0ABS4WYR4_9MICO|nr:hypothetical protein [Brachybacterium sacelli]MBP2381351.1 hypothetical protein [Brachybacterium sacelli]